MTSTLEGAIALALKAHQGQFYPSPEPEPFILHPLRVMLGVSSGPAQVVAALHDVVEDSDVTLNDLATLGFDSVILSAVDRLTRRPEEDYEAYILRLSADPIAREVKLSDLRDNLTNNRRLPPTPDTLARIKKYDQAQTVLAQLA